MKILSHTQLTEGHEAPSTEYTTPDLASLDTYDIWVTQSSDDSENLPDQIQIQVQLEPVPITDLSATVQLIANGTLLTPQRLYEPATVNHRFDHELTHCQMEAVRLRYESSSWEEFLHLEPGSIVYEKPFAIQVSHTIEESRTNPLEDPRHIYGYGGVFTEGLAPHDIQQVYFELFEGLQATEITLATTSHWIERGVIPLTPSQHRGQTVITNAQVTYEQSLSLGTALAEGYARVEVEDSKSEERVVYASTECQRTPDHLTSIDITFTKQGEAL